jgi:hypothetical protein
MLHHKGKAKARKVNNKPTSYTAMKANEVWSWDISYLPTLSLLTRGRLRELMTPNSCIFACRVKLFMGAPLSECSTNSFFLHFSARSLSIAGSEGE